MAIHVLSKLAARSLLTAVILLWAVDAKSANFSFRGTFNQDDNVQVLTFALASSGILSRSAASDMKAAPTRPAL